MLTTGSYISSLAAPSWTPTCHHKTQGRAPRLHKHRGTNAVSMPLIPLILPDKLPRWSQAPHRRLSLHTQVCGQHATLTPVLVQSYIALNTHRKCHRRRIGAAREVGRQQLGSSLPNAVQVRMADDLDRHEAKAQPNHKHTGPASVLHASRQATLLVW